jgi:hypothetical protein
VGKLGATYRNGLHSIIVADLAKWDAHGLVAALKTESAEWDPHSGYWKPAGHFTVATFRRDGANSSTDDYNPDGSVTHSRCIYDESGRWIENYSWMNDDTPHRSLFRYDDAGRHLRTFAVGLDAAETDVETSSYDAEGRRTKVSVPGSRAGHVSYSIEGTNMSLVAAGALRMVITYDQNDLPVKEVLEDAKQNPVSQVIMRRDSAGRLVKVEKHVDSSSMFSMFGQSDPPVSAEADKARSLMMGLLEGIFSETNYAYDAQGRLIERTNSMFNLGLDRTTYRYGDGDDPIEETTEHSHREASLSEDGTLQYTPDKVVAQQNRLEYRYDDHGNWVERTVSIRPQGNADFQISNITRRAITYHSFDGEMALPVLE